MAHLKRTSSFELGDVTYASVEQYMMHQKALCFEDEAIAAQILSTEDPARIKALGREVAGYNDHVWNGLRQLVVYEGLLAKFTQNEELGQRLLSTGGALLAECAVKDRVWGIGLSMGDPARLDPAQWQGQNLLGYTLMRVRAAIRESAHSHSLGRQA